MPLEGTIARLLRLGVYAAMILVAFGVIALVASGTAPFDPAPPLDPGAIPGDLLALRPAGALWLGILVVVATPTARVVAALVGYLRRDESPMALVSALILAVVGATIAAALLVEP